MKRDIYDDGVITVEAVEAVQGVDMSGHLYRARYGAGDVDIRFQLGPVREVGPNGLQCEPLIAMLIHRLRYLNECFSCKENVMAITKLEEALLWLDARTADRRRRQVEGKLAP